LHCVRVRRQSVIFVEVFRLLLVIAGTIGGLTVGNDIGRNSTAPVIGITLGALFSYLIGGIIGRLIDRGLRGAVTQLRSTPASSVFAGSVVGTTGLLLGLVAGLPVIALVHSSIDYPLVSAFAWVLCAAGVRIGVAKGQEIVRATGMSHLLDRPAEPPPGNALLVDSSAVMDRYLLVLGRSGLLVGGVVLARFVLDEVRSLSHSPDPVTSRRAHRGLEAVEALRAGGVQVFMNEDEVPELDDMDERVLALAHRLHVRVGTCSAELAQRAQSRDIEVVDLRHLATELSPDHPVGERLVVDLVKEGRQPRQAVGYLPEGDMVVVNDASHLVGRAEIEVVVSSARQTSQGLLVFAQLFEGGPTLAQRASAS
jgi:uncharacterized protein YacL